MHPATRFIIFYGVLAQIPDHLIQNPVYTFKFYCFSTQIHGNMMALRHILQTHQNILTDGIKIYRLLFQTHASFI